MKKFYASTCILFWCLLSTGLVAQPCSGTPASATAVALSNTVCAGSTASVSMWNVYAFTGMAYQWQSSTVSAVGPFTSIPGATLTSHVTGPLTTGIIWYNVIVTCTNSSQSVQSSVGVTVSPCTNTCSGTPAPTSIVPATQTICASNNVTMNLSTTYTATGISYQWGSSASSSGPFTPISGAVQNNYTSGALNSNTYYEVVIACANGGGTTAATSTVVVANCTNCAGTPGSNNVVPANHTVCTGNPAMMSLANSYTASGIGYQWQSSTVSAVGPFTSISGAIAPGYTSGPLPNTTYFNVIITCTNGGGNISVPHTVSVVPCSTCNVNSNFTLVPTNTAQVWIAIPASSASISAAQWSWGDGSTSNTLFTSHQYSAAGMYTICLSVTLTCGSSSMSCSSYSVYRSASGIIQVNVIPAGEVGLNEGNFFAGNVLVYPNPSAGLFTLQLTGISAPVTIEVRNIVGKLVYRSEEENTGTLKKNFDLSRLGAGMYLMKVIQGKESVTTRITIQY